MRYYITLLLLHAAASLHARPDTTWKTYYGLLHAHTMICDGSGTPAEAYAMAKAAGLHFFAVTPHNHIEAESGAKERKDGILIAKDPALYDGNSNITVTRKWKENGAPRSEQVTLAPLLKAAREATDAHFVALYGQEFSTISSGNHVNVLGTDRLLTTGNGDFRLLLQELDKRKKTDRNMAVIQLNHPDAEQDLFRRGGSPSDRSKMFNDYGIDPGDLGPHFKDWVQAMQPYTHLIEVFCGPAMAEQRQQHYRYTDNENDYFFYLTQGLHISPSAGQDNHYRTWGTVTDARTGIVARSLSEATIYDALRRNRTYVTEDKNLHTALYINDSLMGAQLKAKEGSDLDISIHIRDTDEPTATYEIQVYSSPIRPQLSTAATHQKAANGLVQRSTVRGNGLHRIKGVRANAFSSFCYVKVIQQDGDRSWTAPVWINEGNVSTAAATSTPHTATVPGAAKYYWTTSSSSHVYHLAGCSAVPNIKATNLRSGNTPPAGRTQHQCDVRK
ncbi:hypothetical protein GCM10023093_15010 [Nemorincola caseinilytica]|uniref:PHP domain-containing protein n=1 Tax=Nemorincola caseinilytica TaxID=2054315 RepID=A0ABP8NBD6_9BACT